MAKCRQRLNHPHEHKKARIASSGSGAVLVRLRKEEEGLLVDREKLQAERIVLKRDSEKRVAEPTIVRVEEIHIGA